MHNLIRFFQKNYFVLLFLLLEIVSVLLLVSYQPYHNRIASSVMGDFAHSFLNIRSNIVGYFHLKTENKRLVEENTHLLNFIEHSRHDTLKKAGQTDSIFTFIPARVVNITTHYRTNYIVINKGTEDGIEQNMGIISSEGVVGIITDVSKHFATAMSLLHKQIHVSVRFKNNHHLAQVQWEGRNPEIGIIRHIPTHLTLLEGDSVVTSGNSFLFPEGVLVGTIKKLITSENEDLNAATIRFATDFNSLRQVYVLKNTFRSEFDSLINKQRHEE
ncbi:MAG: rod shape-determining protein MreC [Lentimicrobiaceae bacterium]|jgi:rod shape-determining protein MreC|nr:rod shape-determining protein MreC [Lentimicrobiaceae bacterium]